MQQRKKYRNQNSDFYTKWCWEKHKCRLNYNWNHPTTLLPNFFFSKSMYCSPAVKDISIGSTEKCSKEHFHGRTPQLQLHIISHAIITEKDKYLEMCNSVSLSESQSTTLQKQYKAAGCFTQLSLAMAIISSCLPFVEVHNLSQLLRVGSLSATNTNGSE